MEDYNLFLTKNDKVYYSIKEEIVNGYLYPGERLVASQLAQKYNVSPMPVREALKRLQQDGLIEFVPHVGARVVQVDCRKFEEIVNVRIVLEPLAAKLATDRLKDEQIEKLQKLLDVMKKCITDRNIKQYTLLNNKFHDYIYKNCGNETLYDIIKSLMEKSEYSKSIFFRDVSRIEKSFNEHLECFKHIKNRNSEKVYDSFKDHKVRGFDIIVKKLEEEELERGVR